MNEPSSGTRIITTRNSPSRPGSGSAMASARTAAEAVCRIGRVAAITMMAKTNSGSVKLRESA